MGIIFITAALLILISFPFIAVRQTAKAKKENTPMAKNKLNIFLICSLPVPVIGFALLFKGISYFIR